MSLAFGVCGGVFFGRLRQVPLIVVALRARALQPDAKWVVRFAEGSNLNYDNAAHFCTHP